MIKNLGSIDRSIRFFLGLAIGILGIIFNSWWGLVGILPFATALMGTCPAYLLFGFSTKQKIEVKKIKI